MARRCALTICGSASNLPWLLFSDERLIGPFVVLGLHTDGLRLRFRFDGLLDAHAPFLVDAALVHGMRECGFVGKRFSQCLRLRQHGIRLAEPVVEAPSLGFAAVHRAPGIEERRGAAGANDPRQHVASTHIGSRKTHPHNEKSRPAVSPLRCISTSGPMISCTSPAEQKFAGGIAIFDHPPSEFCTPLITFQQHPRERVVRAFA